MTVHLSLIRFDSDAIRLLTTEHHDPFSGGYSMRLTEIVAQECLKTDPIEHMPLMLTSVSEFCVTDQHVFDAERVMWASSP